jgi:hypothetical protein
MVEKIKFFHGGEVVIEKDCSFGAVFFLKRR